MPSFMFRPWGLIAFDWHLTARMVEQKRGVESEESDFEKEQE
jgi:hypothetical protein